MCCFKQHKRVLSSSEAARHRTGQTCNKHKRPHAACIPVAPCTVKQGVAGMHAGPILTICTAQRKQEAPALVALQQNIQSSRGPRAFAATCSTTRTAYSMKGTYVLASQATHNHLHNPVLQGTPKLSAPLPIGTASSKAIVWQRPPGLSPGSHAVNGRQLAVKSESECSMLATEGPPLTRPPTRSETPLSAPILGPDPYHSSWMRSSRSLSVIGAAAFSFAAP